MNKRIAIKKGKKVKDKELYNFDRTIAKWMLPRLKRFKNITKSYPPKYETYQDWSHVLDKMINSFEMFLSQPDWEIKHFKEPNFLEEYEKRFEEIEEGLHLFADNFLDLWS